MNLSQKRLTTTLILSGAGILFAVFLLAQTATGDNKTAKTLEIEKSC